MDASHRLLQTTRLPGTLRIVRFSLLREEDAVDAASLASAIALFHRDLPCPFEQNGSRALRRPLRFPGLRPESGEMIRGSLWINSPRLPFGGAAVRVAAFSAAFAFGGDASGTIVTSPSVAGRRHRGPRASVASSKASAPSVPGAFARIECAASFGRFTRPFSAAPATPFLHPCGVAPELPCPFDEAVSPASPEPRLGPLNFSKELELGRGPLVELPAIEFSIREHEPWFVETRLATAGLPFGDRAVGVEVRSRLACAARQARHFSRSRGQDDNPMFSRLVHRQTPCVACS